MIPTDPQRSPHRKGLGSIGLIATAAAALGLGGWAAWTGVAYDRDVERRWALPREAKAVAEEEMALMPRLPGELAEGEVRAAAQRHAAAVEALQTHLDARRSAGELSEADASAELKRGTEAARARFGAEMDAANGKAERLVRTWEAKCAGRRLQLRHQATALVAEWDALFARHPEWPRQRLSPEE